MGFFGFGGKDVKDAGEGIESAGKGIGNVLSGIRTLVTGDLPPATIEALKQIELETLKVSQDIQKGQQAIETAAINKGGFNAFFIGAWRPALGWICVIALFNYYIPPVILQTYFWLSQTIATGAYVQFPELFSVESIIGLVGTLLGMGALRTIEKKTGVQGNH